MNKPVCTVVIYTSGSQPTCLCTVSTNLDHGPAGIWAHLKPVLGYIQKNHSDVKHVTFWSDGPTTQYKQKNNFIRLCTEPFEYGFESVSWNHFETGHGKSAVDGVGAAIKRLVHSAARHGKDVNTPQMFEVVKEASQSVKVFFVTDEEFEASVSRAPSAVAVVKGRQQIHQVTSVLPVTIIHREWQADLSRTQAAVDRQVPAEVSNVTNVDRNSALECFLSAYRRPRFCALCKIEVTFVDVNGCSEVAADGGGPTREFLRLLVKDISSSELFTGLQSQRLLDLNSAGTVRDCFVFRMIFSVMGIAVTLILHVTWKHESN